MGGSSDVPANGPARRQTPCFQVGRETADEQPLTLAQRHLPQFDPAATGRHPVPAVSGKAQSSRRQRTGHRQVAPQSVEVTNRIWLLPLLLGKFVNVT